jgi:hypothetical protein
VVAVIHTILRRSPGFSHHAVISDKSELSHLSQCILQSFRSIPLTPQYEIGKNIVYQCLTGPSISCSSVFSNALVMELPATFLYTFGPSRGTERNDFIPPRRMYITVAMFDCSLELPTSGYFNTHVELGNGEEGVESGGGSRWGPSDSVEKTVLTEFIDNLLRSSVDLVCCQRRNCLQRAFARFRIYPFATLEPFCASR